MLPAVRRDRADALDEPQPRGVRVGDLGDERGVQRAHPRLALRRRARAQVGVRGRVDLLLLRVAPHPRTQQAVGYLRARARMHAYMSSLRGSRATHRTKHGATRCRRLEVYIHAFGIIHGIIHGCKNWYLVISGTLSLSPATLPDLFTALEQVELLGDVRSPVLRGRWGCSRSR